MSGAQTMAHEHDGLGLWASALLHALALALLLAMAGVRTLPPSPVEEIVSVEVVAPPPSQEKAGRPQPAQAAPPSFSAAPPPQARVPGKSVPEAPPPAVLPSPGEQPAETETFPGLIAATALYSAQVMADPRSRQARSMMKQLDKRERMLQLCNLEGMQQVSRHGRDFQPDFLVAYAMGDVRMNGQQIIADGAAFRSKGNWFAMRYECGLNPDGQAIADFAFSVGKPVPREQWSARNLVASDGGQD